MPENNDAKPWLSGTETAFARGKDPYRDCRLDWCDGLIPDKDAVIAEGFKGAADKVIQDIEGGRCRGYPDHLFYPVAFLYRHYLELIIKALGRRALRLLGRNVGKGLQGHDPQKLWIKTRRLLEELFPDEDRKILNDTERIILQFDELDKTGQNFRYAKDRSGKPTLRNAPKRVDLANLRKVMSCAANFFDAVECAMCAMEENIDYETDWYQEQDETREPV